MRNFLIDTDTASDDAVAIMMALAEPSVRSRAAAVLPKVLEFSVCSRALSYGFRVG